MLLIELNEFNSDLLRAVAHKHGLNNLNAMLNWRHARTWTDDEYDTGFLEPWVQWVSVHTGLKSKQHEIKNLGDVPNLAQDQIWERWSNQGLSSIVWGVMNGNRRNATNCKVFIPDPWTFSEPAFPSKYDGLIDLPRYLAKNYLEFSKLTAIKKGLRLAKILVATTNRSDFIDGLRVLWRGYNRFGATNAVFIVFFEYLSAMAFIKAVETHKPESAIIFINMLAHVQHHYWTSQDGSACPQIKHAAEAVDEILGKLQDRCGGIVANGRIAIMNALSQNCTIDESPWVLYRPNNHAKVLRFLGLKTSRVEPLMTYDAHVFFANSADTERGAKILEGVRIEGKPLFVVERDAHDQLKLFYRVGMHDPLKEDVELVYGNSTARFFDHFTAIVQRTGKHVQQGDLFANFEIEADSIPNHELLQLIERSRTSAELVHS